VVGPIGAVRSVGQGCHLSATICLLS